MALPLTPRYKIIVNPVASRGAGERAIPQIEGALKRYGLFDLCIAREVSRARIFGLIPRFVRGAQATQEPIRTRRAQRVIVTAVEGVLPAHADGETLCTDGRRPELELLPRQIEIISRPSENVE